MNGCQEIPEGWKTVECHIDRIEGYVRIIITEQTTGKTLFASRYSNEVAYIMAQTLTMNAIKNEEEAKNA